MCLVVDLVSAVIAELYVALVVGIFPIATAYLLAGVLCALLAVYMWRALLVPSQGVSRQNPGTDEPASCMVSVGAMVAFVFAAVLIAIGIARL